MKNTMTILAMLFSSVCAFAQTDSVPQRIDALISIPNTFTPSVANDSTGVNNTLAPESLLAAAATSSSSAIDYSKSLVEMPSPDMVSLINQVNANVDLFTGKANASLPIYTLKSYDIQVPISLEYSSNGVKVDEVGSWVGLGWSLNAGGAITRIMKNSPDESIRKMSFIQITQPGQTPASARWDITLHGYLRLKENNSMKGLKTGFYLKNFTALAEGNRKKVIDYSNWFPPKVVRSYYGDGEYNIGLDTEPDEFYYKFGAYAGKFVFNQDRQILCIPDYKFKIEPTIKSVEGEDKIVAFKVTTTEGYVYYFGDANLETVESTKHRYYTTSQSYYYKHTSTFTDAPFNDPFSPRALTSYNYSTTAKAFANDRNQGNEVNYYTSAWHLNKIQSPTSDVVTLKYDNVDLQYVEDRSYSASVPNFRDPIGSLIPWGTSPTTPYVTSKIAPIYYTTWPTTVSAYPTTASYAHFVSIAYVKSKKLRQIYTQSNNSVVFKANADRVDLLGGKKLEEITLFLDPRIVLLNPTYTKKWKFNYLDKVPYPATTYPKEYKTHKNTDITTFVNDSYGYINSATSAGVGNKQDYINNQLNIYKSEFNRTLLSGLDEEGYISPTSINTVSLYKVNYFDEDKTIPKRFSVQQDKLGYYSDLKSASHPNIDISTGYKDPAGRDGLYVLNSTLPSGVRFSFGTPDFRKFSTARYYAIKKITNNLGGVTEYDYTYRDKEDLKVYSLSNTTNGKTQTKTYEYRDIKTLNSFIKQYQVNLLTGTEARDDSKRVPTEGAIVYSSRAYDMNLNHGSFYTSGSVIVNESGNGSTFYYLNNYTPRLTQVLKVIDNSPASSIECSSCYPFPKLDDYEWNVGSNYRTFIRDNSPSPKTLKQVFSPLEKRMYLWGTAPSTTLDGAPSTVGLKGGMTIVRDKDGNRWNDEYRFGTFSYVSAATVFTESQETDYFLKANDPTAGITVSKTKTSEYSIVNNRVRSETTTNSDNKVYTQTYKYAFDFPQTVGSQLRPCNPYSNSYKLLVDKHMIGMPLETLSFVSGTTKAVNGTKVIYDCLYRPKYFYKYGTNLAECTSPENVTPDWFLQYQIAEYETFGRPKTIKYACNPHPITLGWDIDKIRSKSYINRTSAYQYADRTRQLINFTDVDGLVSEFQYDEFFRLKHSTGRNGNVVNDYAYQTIGIQGTENSVQTTTNYFGNYDQTLQNKKTLDGFGRTLSATQIGFTPTGADISATVEYDAYGRPFSEVDPTKGTTPKTTLYELSPLSRVLSVKPHGSEKPITYKYGANEEALTIAHNGTAVVYPIGSLYVNTVLDEDGKPSMSYTDKLGRTVMTRRKITETTFADTKYLYNERGQVIKTLPPDNGDPFLYEFNTDGSLRRKTIPGFKNQLDGSLSWINYKYDARGRLNYTKDPNGNVTDITYTDYDEPLQTKVNNVVVKNIFYATSGVEIGKPISVSTMALETQTGLIGSGRTAVTSLGYDEYGRVNSTINNGITGLTRTNQNWTEYWNTSDLLYYNYNSRDNNTNDNTSSYKINEYDHAGRVIWSYDLGHASNAQNNNYYWLGAYTNHSYKENGWLQNKSVLDYGNWQKIQQTDYDYNNRGWLTAINDFGGSNKGSANVDFNCTALGQSNCVQVTRNFRVTVDFNKNPCRTRFCTVKDMKIAYSLDDEDKNGVVKKRDGLIYIPSTASSSYYSNTASTTATVTIRRDNIEASLDALVDKIFNLLVAQRIDQFNALSYATQFRAQLKTELLQQFCPPSDRLFTEKIHYEDRHRQLNGTTYTPQYNGNISWVEWQVGDRRRQGYGYTYDALDRLTNARYAELTRGGFLEFGSLNPNLAQYNESITYNDARGNIKNLNRYGLVETPNPNVDCIKYGKIDELSYIYDATSNRLKTVTDAAMGTAATSKGVVNGGGGYEYDFNGNMVEDKSKRLKIKYNFLNLPYEFTFASATGAIVGRIFITYDVDGNKLRKETFTGTSTTPTSRHDYDNGVEYENNALEFINLGSCRVVKDNVAANTYRAEHFLTDHLGNTRVVYSDLNRDGRIDENTEIVQENQYYPMGMQMEGTWNNKKVLGSPKQNYKFNGSEWTEDFGLNWGDHGARYYLPAVGVWNGIDALAESYDGYSPFHFAMGNPISFSDPTGMGSQGWIEGGYGVFWDKNVNSQSDFNAKYGQDNLFGFTYKGMEGHGFIGSTRTTYYGPDGKTHDMLASVELPTFTFDQGARDIAYLSSFSPKADPHPVYDLHAYEPNAFERIKESSLVGSIAYNSVDAFYVTLQYSNPWDASRTHLNGALMNRREADLAFVNAASNFVPLGKAFGATESLGISLLSKYSAPQFSQLFKGTLVARSSPVVRGTLNKGLNMGVNYINGKIKVLPLWGGQLLLKGTSEKK